jgi:hypothetical protein
MPGLPSQEGTQDHPVSLQELSNFCSSLNPGILSDVVAGALASSLFFGLGRTPELLHAKQHPPMQTSALRKLQSPIGGDCTYSFCLTYPKVRTLNTQFISPLLSYGITSANFWISRLKALSPYSNMWQIHSVRRQIHSVRIREFTTEDGDVKLPCWRMHISRSLRSLSISYPASGALGDDESIYTLSPRVIPSSLLRFFVVLATLSQVIAMAS